MVFWEIAGAGLVALILAAFITPVVRHVALRLRAIRQPGGRHIHERPTPLLGGIGIVFSVLVVLLFHPTLVLTAPIVALLLGMVFLMLVGIIDDIMELSWWALLSAQIVAALLLVGGGVKLLVLNNPFGEAIDLSNMLWFGSVLLVLWIVVVMNAVNWLDGADGIAGGVVGVALVTLVGVSLFPYVMQPPLAIIAATGAGAIVGFLFWNRPPARIFLGSSGSLVLGFFVSALAVLAGAKIATAATVLLIPLADMLAVVIKRLINKKRITLSDTSHLHFLLRESGIFGMRLFVLYVVAAGFLGVVSLYVPQPLKVILLVVTFVALVLGIVRLGTSGVEKEK